MYWSYVCTSRIKGRLFGCAPTHNGGAHQKGERHGGFRGGTGRSWGGDTQRQCDTRRAHAIGSWATLGSHANGSYPRYGPIHFSTSSSAIPLRSA